MSDGSQVSILVKGQAYGGWKSVRVMRSIEAICGSFDLSVSDRFPGQDLAWPIVEEDECTVKIGDVPVLVGYVDARRLGISEDESSYEVTGRDRTGDLVDCSVFLPESGASKKGKKSWQFVGVSPLDLAIRVAKPYGIPVSLQAGLSPPAKVKKFAVSPGDSAAEVIEKACRLAGLLPVADGAGGLVLARAGSGRATTPLIMGKGGNVKRVSAVFDSQGRFATYAALAQGPGTDDAFGTAAAHVQAYAEDAGVKRPWRTLVVRPEGPATAAQCQLRAQWEAKVRAARGDAIGVTVEGWRQLDGTLWPINATVQVQIPQVGVVGQMLITEAQHTIDDSSGELTQLTIRRPDAFLPEPTTKDPATGPGSWKRLKGGV